MTNWLAALHRAVQIFFLESRDDAVYDMNVHKYEHNINIQNFY